jgi:hypothetical protein
MEFVIHIFAAIGVGAMIVVLWEVLQVIRDSRKTYWEKRPPREPEIYIYRGNILTEIRKREALHHIEPEQVN